MDISPSDDVVRVSGPVTGHNAGELIRAIVAHDVTKLQLDDYASDDRQLVTDLLLRIDAWLAMRDRRLGVSVAGSPGLDPVELKLALGPDSHIVVAESPGGEDAAG
jgi:hypothetical protein